MDSSFRRKNTHKKACIVLPKEKKERIVRNYSKKDGISELHDDILIHIVSFIPVKEAGKSSVLSKRWKHVWEYMTVLDFDASKIKGKRSSWKTRAQNEDSYCNLVERVLFLHKASTIDKFRIHNDLDTNRSKNIDSWIRFAIEKRVKRLEVNIERLPSLPMGYDFPSVSFCNMLRSIELANVNVTGEYLERLLYECQSLEVLSIERSHHLRSLKFAGPSLSLKSLKLKSCIGMKHLEILAPNLTSCYYVGPRLQSSPFVNTPKLVELYVGGTCGNHVLSKDLNVSSCISQIEVLTIDSLFIQLTRVAKVFPECARLKVLHVTVNLISEDELFALHFLLKACPLLRKFCSRA